MDSINILETKNKALKEAFDEYNETKSSESSYRLYLLIKDDSSALEFANELLLNACDNDLLKAKNALASIYASGNEITSKDPDIAISILKECSEKGYDLATINLAYYLSIHTRDEAERVNNLNILRTYVNSKDKVAQYYYGKLLIEGNVVNKDERLGFLLVKASANQDFPRAIRFVADSYYSGDHTNMDRKAAVNYYEKLVKYGDVEVIYLLANIYTKGEGVTPNFQRALDLYYYAANMGEVKAMTLLGDYYSSGHIVKLDNSLAFAWYKKAANKNDSYAIERLGDAYLNGLGVDTNYKEARNLYLKALELGNLHVYDSLGRIYKNGLGTLKNNSKALEYFKLGYECEEPYSSYDYATMLEDGVNGKKDPRGAYVAYKVAADKDILPAIKKVGDFLLRGKGVSKDLSKALSYYLRASIMGDTESTVIVGVIKKQIDLNSIR